MLVRSKLFIGGVEIDASFARIFPNYIEPAVAATLDTTKFGQFEVNLKLHGRGGFNRLLRIAWVERTHTGAWLVCGRGPTRRYSTRALAERAADRRHRGGP